MGLVVYKIVMSMGGIFGIAVISFILMNVIRIRAALL
jgi:hypothetical protein